MICALRRTAILSVVAAWLAGTPAGWAEPALFEGPGGWGAVTGLSADAMVPAEGRWLREQGVWTGHLPAQGNDVKLGDVTFSLADALPPPPAPAWLSAERNAFGKCILRSLSVRFDSALFGRRWSVIFPAEGRPAEIAAWRTPSKREVPWWLEAEDVVTGERWTLTPDRLGSEGGWFARVRGATRLYAGSFAEGDLDWMVMTAPAKDGMLIIQGRVTVMKSESRFIRLRVRMQSGAPGHPVAQEETEGACGVVAWRDGEAMAMQADLGEPRRMRALLDADACGLEFDLAPTVRTRNFPRTASFSLTLEGWACASPDAAAREASGRLARNGGTNTPPADGPRAAGVVALCPALARLDRAGGFAGSADVMAYLQLRMSGLFRGREGWPSVFLCAVRSADGGNLMELDGQGASIWVNPDPDLETVLELGVNRGLDLRVRTFAPGVTCVFVRAGEGAGRLDFHSRALKMCDYPAVWEVNGAADESAGAELQPGVDLGHVTAEWLAAMSCELRERGIPLLVEDASLNAPFTTYHANALVTESVDPAEMRRQRALAGERPVFWMPAEGTPPEAAVRVARELEFVFSPVAP